MAIREHGAENVENASPISLAAFPGQLCHPEFGRDAVTESAPSVTVMAARRILVIDDTPALLDVIRGCLEEEGYQVRTCLESRHAVGIAREQRPDVIMLDLVMPEVSGWEVLAQLRQDPAFVRTPVIVCTAYVAEAVGRLAELKGPDQHLGLLPKPFEIEELIEVVESVTSAALSK
jgi:CheY-like chemotaxis protein